LKAVNPEGTTTKPESDLYNGLTPLEVSAGLPIGPDPGVEPLARTPKGYSPLTALDDLIRPALERPPCLVSFSGGRDSSAILAAATRLARLESLPLPIPATIRFPNATTTEESEWQELVVAHLQLADWVRLEFEDELDLVGPVARVVLRKHGLLWPDNTFFFVPLLEAASGGSLLSGIGGDEVFATRWPYAIASSMLSGRLRPTRARLRMVGLDFVLGVAPRRVARAYHSKGFKFGWLRPEAERAFSQAMGDWYAEAPNRFDVSMRAWRWPSRFLQVLSRSYATLAKERDVRLVHPFADPAFLGAVATEVGWKGFAGRTEAMKQLFGDILPEASVSRGSKVHFDEIFISRHTRSFAERWNGEGVDDALVDPEVLRDTWLTAADGRSYLVMQAAWLTTQPPDTSGGG
jgi:asparagine synthase (glutamine-hydrolysing)